MVQCAMVAVPVVLALLLAMAASQSSCTAVEDIVSSLLNATVLAGVSPNNRLSSVRTPADDYAKLRECIVRQGCSRATCTCPPNTDSLCRDKCRFNCLCDCDGMPGSKSLSDGAPVNACIYQRLCSPKFNMCRLSCSKHGQGCETECYFAQLQCACECNQVGLPTASTERGGYDTIPADAYDTSPAASPGTSTGQPASSRSTPKPSASSSLRHELAVPVVLAAFGMVLVTTANLL